MNIRTEIVDQFTRVAEEHGKDMPSLDDETLLMDSGLDSLCFAIIVTRLEDSLGFDPFNAESTLFPVTFGEFVHLYESSAKQVSESV
jgi:acyl carrier protein